MNGLQRLSINDSAVKQGVTHKYLSKTSLNKGNATPDNDDAMRHQNWDKVMQHQVTNNNKQLPFGNGYHP